MFNPTHVMMEHCIQQLLDGYRHVYGSLNCDHADLISWVATTALEAIAHSDAPYHDIEHTILVSLVGQEILRGKHLQEGNVFPQDWLNYITALLCHDIGYIKGVCHQDRMAERLYVTGNNTSSDGAWVALSDGRTDASLTPYHVDRGQQFVIENFAGHPLIDVHAVNRNIELTRFPAPNTNAYQDISHYPGLTRAADLIGQLSDPRYLQKLPALFYEFEETGTNQQLGYRHPGDLRAGYPMFYRQVVYQYIQKGLGYLKATQQGRQIIANLYAHVWEVEQEYAGVGVAA